MIPTDKVLSVGHGHPERSGQQCWLLERGWGGGLFCGLGFFFFPSPPPREGRIVHQRRLPGGYQLLSDVLG